MNSFKPKVVFTLHSAVLTEQAYKPMATCVREHGAMRSQDRLESNVLNTALLPHGFEKQF